MATDDKGDDELRGWVRQGPNYADSTAPPTAPAAPRPAPGGATQSAPSWSSPGSPPPVRGSSVAGRALIFVAGVLVGAALMLLIMVLFVL